MEKWEEKNYTEQEKNCLNNNERGEIDITISMPRKSKIKECKNTGWTRNCPKCNKVITYTDKYNCKYADRDKRPCKECKEHDPVMLKKLHQGNVGRKRSQEHIEKVRQSRLGKKHTDTWKRQASIRNRGRKMPEGFGNKVRGWMTGNKNSTGKPKPIQWKEKLIAKMARNYQEPQNFGKAFLPNYNENACQYFDWLNKFMGWNGQYATFGGEKNVLTYFVDYYEPNLNLVIEWDEAHHRKQIAADKKRQDEIKRYLGCRFFRYDVLTSCLKEV